MRTAIVSDIHSNLEALNAVLKDIQSQGVDRVYCLGDTVGYGPNPVECLDIARRFDVCILGNHDQAVIFDPEGFSPVAYGAICYSRAQLENAPGGAGANNERWDFLGELPRTHVEPTRLYVHGSPRDPTNEYIFPEDIYNHQKIKNLFDRVEQYCFQGHTHIPGVFTPSLEFFSPDECKYEYHLGNDKALFNVGSVGQPRDGDPRASYAILTDEMVAFRRVEYDFHITIQKIYDTPELDNMLGDRLSQGR